MSKLGINLVCRSDGRADGQADGRTDGRTGGRMDGPMRPYREHVKKNMTVGYPIGLCPDFHDPWVPHTSPPCVETINSATAARVVLHPRASTAANTLVLGLVLLNRFAELWAAVHPTVKTLGIRAKMFVRECKYYSQCSVGSPRPFDV